MDRLDVAVDAMRMLRAEGFRFSIDDFGTGYSSLSYLSRLPIDTLKIDRAFVSALDKGPENLAIVRAIQQLGQVLQRRVVAEGIETAEQLASLRKMGVDAGQGYLLARRRGGPACSAPLGGMQPLEGAGEGMASWRKSVSGLRRLLKAASGGPIALQVHGPHVRTPYGVSRNPARTHSTDAAGRRVGVVPRQRSAAGRVRTGRPGARGNAARAGVRRERRHLGGPVVQRRQHPAPAPAADGSPLRE
jgi:EAL domain-containing protein (putative c-di-GMP-specific phosphodiesterase class I)